MWKMKNTLNGYQQYNIEKNLSEFKSIKLSKINTGEKREFKN